MKHVGETLRNVVATRDPCAVGSGVTAEVVVATSVTADAVLGCGRFCGFRATCAADANATAAPACTCDCGWGGAACNEPAGFCDAPLSLLLPGNTSDITSDFASECRGAPRPPLPLCDHLAGLVDSDSWGKLLWHFHAFKETGQNSPDEHWLLRGTRGQHPSVQRRMEESRTRVSCATL